MQTLSHSSSLTSLPTELLRDIAFLSFNPNLYFVCQNTRSRLCSFRHFLQDLSLLVFADRTGNYSSAWCPAWCGSKVLPWSTSSARQWNLNLDYVKGQRYHVQKQVLALESVTAVRLTFMIRFVLQSWINWNVPFVQTLPANRIECLQRYCLTTKTSYHEYAVEDELGHRLSFEVNSIVRVTQKHPLSDEHVFYLGYIVDMQAPPTRLIQADENTDGYELGMTLLHRTRMDSLNHSIVKKYLATAKPKWMET